MESAYLGVACGGAEAGVVRARLVELVAQVGPGAGAVTERGVHDGGVKLLDSSVWADGTSKGGAGVGVGASDGDLESSLPLSIVHGGLGIETGAPKGAFDVREGRRILASSAGFLGWRAFKKHVKAY
jgi:hypothetical protein